jgi:hypothetical protein
MRGTIHPDPAAGQGGFTVLKSPFALLLIGAHTVGRLAQLGERCVRNAEVRSSILLPSTNLRS